ncbi:MAG: ATP-binding protein [Planctomycetes bacterium]|nr:ATP-binding protein [Planctomycetota bacterium]
MNRLELKFSTSAEMTRAVFQMFSRILNSVGMDEETRTRFMLAVGEAIDNAVIHGNKFSADKFIEVECFCNLNKITFMVADQGDGFDYRKHLDTPIAEFQAPKLIEKTMKFGSPGGLGLALIRKCADEVIFTPPGNRVSFVKYI